MISRSAATRQRRSARRRASCFEHLESRSSRRSSSSMTNRVGSRVALAIVVAVSSRHPAARRRSGRCPRWATSWRAADGDDRASRDRGRPRRATRHEEAGPRPSTETLTALLPHRAKLYRDRDKVGGGPYPCASRVTLSEIGYPGRPPSGRCWDMLGARRDRISAREIGAAARGRGLARSARTRARALSTGDAHADMAQRGGVLARALRARFPGERGHDDSARSGARPRRASLRPTTAR